MTYQYPTSELDSADRFLERLGTFWSSYYQGRPLASGILQSRCQLEAQTYLTFMELVASISRFQIPIFHTENWYFLSFRESEINNFEGSLVRYGDGYNYEINATLRYGVQQSQPYWAVPAPETLTKAPLLLNRLTATSRTLVHGIDYYLQPGRILFTFDPFADDLIPKRDIYTGDEVTDREAGLWLFRSQWDWDSLYEQFGYALQLRLASSENAKRLLNALFDAIVLGTNRRALMEAWSAITDVPLAVGDETVETITDDQTTQLVITDKAVYQIPFQAAAAVSVGETLVTGQAISNGLEYIDLRRGITPDIPALVLDHGMVGCGYVAGLIFENKTVPLIVEENVDGYTKVSFEIGGFELDVQHFWDEVHRRGVESGQTLANALTSSDFQSLNIEPTANNLPSTINPFQFLCENILRYQALIVRLRPASFGSNALSLAHARHLSKIVPPRTMMLVVVELELPVETVIMEGPGTETAPGYSETMATFPCCAMQESVTPASVSESFRAFQIAIRCE